VAATPGSDADVTPLVPAWQLAPWSQRVDALRATIGDAMVKRVTAARAEQERRCDLVLTAFGTVLFAVLEAVVLLTQRVVKPLSYLGQAITRIANGDRGVPLVLQSGTSEITEMVTAVETLRQAALVADATASRQRMAARHRLDQLRQALGIAGSVQEPARALERGVSRLSEGLDATIALIATATDAPPPTLGTAAIAVRLGLADMRESAADLDASFAAASSAQEEDRPEAEYLSHILTVQAQVDRRDRVVRAFVRPSLAALRDASGAMGEASGPGLRELVTDQFARIEETVAMVASMRDAVARATAIVRGLPLDDTPMAA
jgi:HAMP domain